MVGDKADWLVREVRSSDPLDPEVEHFKITEKKPISPTIDVNVRPMNIPERQAIAIVVKKTRDNTDHGDLELISDQNKLARVLDIMKKVAIVKELFGGTSAVGRNKVDKEITAQEYNYAWMVLFHL